MLPDEVDSFWKASGPERMILREEITGPRLPTYLATQPDF